MLGAWYLLTMLRRVFFGPVKEPTHGHNGVIGDLNVRELAALVPVAALCVVLGVYPQPFLDVARPDLATVSDLAHLAQEHGGTAVARGTMPAVPVQRTAFPGEVK